MLIILFTNNDPCIFCNGISHIFSKMISLYSNHYQYKLNNINRNRNFIHILKNWCGEGKEPSHWQHFPFELPLKSFEGLEKFEEEDVQLSLSSTYLHTI